MTATLPPPPTAPLPEMQTKPAPPLDKLVKANSRHLTRVLAEDCYQKLQWPPPTVIFYQHRIV